MRHITKALALALTLGFLSGSVLAEQSIQATFDNIDDIKSVKVVTPKYPKLAIRGGAEGYVVLSYSLDKAGKPVNIKVIDEHPKRVFTHSAKRALAASRYEMTDADGETVAVKGLVQRYDFAFPEEFKKNRTAYR